ncbi:MAG: FeoA family protein [Polaromonas sp.]|uniref:FeoA family protein n=1 Tax=Polaromonas sp. TaxID=1869339 RepID=UPI0040360BA9
MTLAALSSPTSLPAGVLLLADQAPQQVSTIVGLAAAQGEPGNAGLLQRLAELGFMAGETICVLRRGPGGREPIAVQVGDTVFALRRHEASCIQVRVCA